MDKLRPLMLNVGFAEQNADWNWKNVNSPFMRLYYVTEGNAQVILPNGTQPLKAGHLYCIPAFTTHSYHCTSRFCHYYIHLYEAPQQTASLLDEWELPSEVPASEQDLQLVRRLCDINPQMSLESPDPTYYDFATALKQNFTQNKKRKLCDQIESYGIVYQLLARFIRDARPKTPSKDERIVKALTYIRDHLYEPIGLNSLIQNAYLSKDHFIRLFKKETGLTPVRYIHQKKIEKAQLILLTDNIPIKSIAYSLAFDDYSYFIRVFKKVTGTTPQAYRNARP